jgi:hypothetical protein
MDRLILCAGYAQAIPCPSCGLVHRIPFSGWRNPHEVVCQCGITLDIVQDIVGAFERVTVLPKQGDG